MTIREELKELGPELVRRAMPAFAHRGDRGAFGSDGGYRCADWDSGDCCFLRHAFGIARFPDYLGWRGRGTLTEFAFEHGDRNGLRLECIAFLAEHGTAVEIAPKKSPRAIRVAALVCLLLLVL